MRAVVSPCDAIVFKGPRDGMESAWPDIGLLAITSRAEGLPLAALEAMAHGVPVAAFAVGDLPALIDHGSSGFIAPAGDLAALRACVAAWHAMSPEQHAAMGQAAWRCVRDRYSRETGASRVAAIHDAAARPGRRAPAAAEIL
jgi:glycosyltransferase involved in cell wall biosynthesis